MVTPVALATDSSTTDGTTYTTASITPTANRLILAAVVTSVGTGLAPIPTVTGCNLTWDLAVTSPAGLRTVFIFRAMGAAPTAGPLTITSPSTVTSALWQVVEWTGAATTGTNGDGAIVQTVGAKPTAVTGASLPFTNTVDPANATYAAVAVALAELPVAGPEWASLGAVSRTAPNTGFLGEAATSAAQTITATWSAASNSFLAGVEIKVAGPVAVSADLSGAGTLTVSVTPKQTLSAGLSGTGTLGASAVAQSGADGWGASFGASFGSGAGPITATVSAALRGSGGLSTTATAALLPQVVDVALSGSGALTTSRAPKATLAAYFASTGALLVGLVSSSPTMVAVWVATEPIYFGVAAGSVRGYSPTHLVPDSVVTRFPAQFAGKVRSELRVIQSS